MQNVWRGSISPQGLYNAEYFNYSLNGIFCTSFFQIYGEKASAKDCRIHVQKLNALRGELGVFPNLDEYNDNHQDDNQFESMTGQTRLGLEEIIVKEVETTKWNQFLQPESEDFPAAKRFKSRESSSEGTEDSIKDILSILKRSDVIEKTQANVVCLSPPLPESDERNTEAVLSILKRFDVKENTNTKKRDFDLVPTNLDDLFGDEPSEEIIKNPNGVEVESLLRKPMFETCDFDEIDFDV